MSRLKRWKYFLFIAWNWDWKIATHIIKEEKNGEEKYQLESTGFHNLSKLKKQAEELEHSTIYMPASFDLLDLCFSEIDLPNSQHFLDIGCGMGRVMVVAAHFGAKKITGIDVAKNLLQEAKKNIAILERLKPQLEINCQLQNAYYFDIPDDVDVIFLFNPFDEVVMDAVAENILESLERNKRKIKIIYLNPMEKQCFTERGFKQVFHFVKMKYLEAVILER
jgi:SAM-dependent methyltransferase